MKVVFSQECLEYGNPWHPESSQRVELASEYLRDRFGFIEPAPGILEAIENDLLLVHSEEHVRSLKNAEFSDADSPAYPDIYRYACISAAAAITAATNSALSLTRPPGHHAGRSRVAGFCYFNNVAIAVRKLARKTLIVDIDGHHGDGTESIFLGDPNVIYVSLHRSPLYPGTGLESRENCHNYPLTAPCGDKLYLETLYGALDVLDMKGVEQLAVSAGFDAYETDPLASLGLTGGAYKKIGNRLARLKLPVFAVLEGGYDAVNLGPNVEQFLRGLEPQ